MKISLEQTFCLAFDRCWESFLHDPRMIRMPERPTLLFAEDPKNEKTAELLLQKPVIRVYQGFLVDIQEIIEKHAQVLSQACLNDLDLKAHEADTRLLACVLEITASLVLLHELFHILCGHWDVVRSLAPDDHQALSLDEAIFTMGETTSDAIASRIEINNAPSPHHRSYFLELEADNTALQWLMQAAPPNTLSTLLSALWPNGFHEPPSAIADLEGSARILAFRLLFSASWLVVLLMEQKRPEALLKKTRSHPLPAARLLANTFTLMEQFAELDSIFVGESGYKTLTLTDRESRDMVGCLRKVIVPVLKAPWPVSDSSAVREGLVAFSPFLITELRNILSQKPPESGLGDELEKIELLRREMTDRFQPHRCFTP